MKENLGEVKVKLKNSGLKMTPQRIAILNALSKTKLHPEVGGIFAKIKKLHPEMSLATVYSNLKSLQKAGLVQEIGSFGDIRRFDGNSTPHLHIVCISCSRIDDLNSLDQGLIDKLDSHISKKTNYKILKRNISFFGWCVNCKRKGQKYKGGE